MSPLPRRTLVVSLLCLALAIAPAFVPDAGVAQPRLGDAAPPTKCVPSHGSEPTASGTVNGTIGQVSPTSYRIRYDLTGSEDRNFDVWIPREVTVNESDGFTRDGDRYYSWDGRTQRPSLTLSGAVDYGNQRFEWRQSSDWIFGVLPRYPGPGPAVSLQPETEGYVGDDLFYLGAYSTATREVGCQEITQVFADSATVSFDHGELLDAYAWTARRLDTGYATEEVDAFAVPGVDTRVGGQGFTTGSDFVVFTPNTLRTAANPWLHEYVHTRQHFETTENATWFREASATYLAARAALEGGLVTPQAYDRELAVATSRWPARDTLTERRYLETPYLRGLTVLSRLDVALEGAPNESVLGLLRYANSQETVSQRQLEEWAGTRRDAESNESFQFHRAASTTADVRPGYVLGPAWLPAVVRRVLPALSQPTVRAIFAATGVIGLLGGLNAARGTGRRRRE